VRLGILQVQEGRGILTRMTVQENLEMGAYARSGKAEIRDDMEMVFDKFPVLRDRRKQFGATLSGGEQQMLAIGRALMARPKLLMLDEPSLGLAPMLVKEIFRIVADFKREAHRPARGQNAGRPCSAQDRGYVAETGAIVLTAPEKLSSRARRCSAPGRAPTGAPGAPSPALAPGDRGTIRRAR
jgi:branched-chain amino acid transport system ATP-binding protein